MSHQLLHCPISRTALMQASDDILTMINKQIEIENIITDNGTTIELPVESMLVTKDMSRGYLIRAEIPQLIPGLSISLMGLNTVKSVD